MKPDIVCVWWSNNTNDETSLVVNVTEEKFETIILWHNLCYRDITSIQYRYTHYMLITDTGNRHSVDKFTYSVENKWMGQGSIHIKCHCSTVHLLMARYLVSRLEENTQGVKAKVCWNLDRLLVWFVIKWVRNQLFTLLHIGCHTGSVMAKHPNGVEWIYWILSGTSSIC